MKVVKCLQRLLPVFSWITTGVVFVTAVYIEIFWGNDTKLEVKILWQILLVSAVCTIGSQLIYGSEDKEISKRSGLIRNILIFVYVNVVVMGAGILFEWYYLSDWKMLLGMEVCIVLVYAGVFTVGYIAASLKAKELNRRLKERK